MNCKPELVRHEGRGNARRASGSTSSGLTSFCVPGRVPKLADLTPSGRTEPERSRCNAADSYDWMTPFKTGRASQPGAWKVRLLRRSVPAKWLLCCGLSCEQGRLRSARVPNIRARGPQWYAKYRLPDGRGPEAHRPACGAVGPMGRLPRWFECRVAVHVRRSAESGGWAREHGAASRARASAQRSQAGAERAASLSSARRSKWAPLPSHQPAMTSVEIRHRPRSQNQYPRPHARVAQMRRWWQSGLG
jgi:hypothetical protein